MQREYRNRERDDHFASYLTDRLANTTRRKMNNKKEQRGQESNTRISSGWSRDAQQHNFI